jgi:signal transduction histidine kinase
LNSKKIEFLISISLVFVFSLVVVLYLNFLFTTKINFTQVQYLVFLVFLVFVGLFVFLLFSSSFIKFVFKSSEKLEKDIKNTIHELNIPASTIKMNVQLLQKNITEEKDLARLERISKANDNLFKLYENLEYEFKKEINKIELEEFYLEDIIKTSLDKFEDIKKDTIIEKNIKNLLLYCDYNGFLIVLDNLFSNAIKYNDPTDPYIKVELNDMVLSIFNFGQKIDTKNIMLVFDRYFQENSQNRGFGLGLAIVKEFCDKYKILINIESLENGTKINLNLKNILANSQKKKSL